MAGPQNGVVNGMKQSSTQPEADFAQALKDLDRGERQASQMENQLDALEKRIDDLLAQAEAEQQHAPNGESSSADKSEPATKDESKQA